MEYFVNDDIIEVRAHKNNHSIQIDTNTTIDYIQFTINSSTLIIDRHYIIQNITPNFTVEMCYYVLVDFIKYDNYSLVDNSCYYIFSGYYSEPYEQGDTICINLEVLKNTSDIGIFK